MASLLYTGVSHPNQDGTPGMLVTNATRFGQRFDGRDLNILLRMWQGRRITIQIDVALGEDTNAITG